MLFFLLISVGKEMKVLQDFTAIDIETTGLNPKTERIIEVGAVRVRDGKITDQFESLLNPGRKLEEKIVELTGITDEIPHKAHRAVEDAKAAALLYEKLAGQFGEEGVFEPCRLNCQVKREAPATTSQKEQLYKLAREHKLVLEYDVNTLTRNEASRMADKIILKYGKSKKPKV